VRGPRPGRLVVVLGTGTDVGKTWVSAAVLATARAGGATVAARKPVQSFEPGAGPTDAEILAGATGEPVDSVSPAHRSYGVPFAPPMAADFLGLPPILNSDLLDEIVWPDPPADLGLVEMAGGVASPVSSDAGPLEFIAGVGPDRVILVADAGLGVINAVRVSVSYLANNPHTRHLADNDRLSVVLNRLDPSDELHLRNSRWITGNDRVEAVASGVGELTFASGLVDRILSDEAFVRP
jgi:dethiobiotin synthetase